MDIIGVFIKPLRVLKNLSTARIFGKVGFAEKPDRFFQYSLSLVIIIFLFYVLYRQFFFPG